MQKEPDVSISGSRAVRCFRTVHPNRLTAENTSIRDGCEDVRKMDLCDYKAEVRRDNRDQGDVNERSNHKSNYFRNDMHPACKHQLH